MLLAGFLPAYKVCLRGQIQHRRFRYASVLKRRLAYMLVLLCSSNIFPKMGLPNHFPQMLRIVSYLGHGQASFRARKATRKVSTTMNFIWWPPCFLIQ
jgi:hypothetical protein